MSYTLIYVGAGMHTPLQERVNHCLTRDSAERKANQTQLLYLAELAWRKARHNM